MVKPLLLMRPGVVQSRQEPLRQRIFMMSILSPEWFITMHERCSIVKAVDSVIR
jgi:hypothetical protein